MLDKNLVRCCRYRYYLIMERRTKNQILLEKLYDCEDNFIENKYTESYLILRKIIDEIEKDLLNRIDLK